MPKKIRIVRRGKAKERQKSLVERVAALETSVTNAPPPAVLALVKNDVPPTPVVPKKVAIVAMGASSSAYNSIVAGHGHRKAMFDETWGINSMGACILTDRMFVMQDIKHNIAKESESRKVAQGIQRWLPEYPGPVYTTTAYPEWPCLVEYPTEDVLNSLGGPPYLNNSVAYALAFAMFIGVKEIFLFGADFSYPDNHASESGRGCVEYLIGIGVARGIKFGVPPTSTILDACVPEERKLYGYEMPLEHKYTEGRISLIRKHTSDNPLDPGPKLAMSDTPVKQEASA